MRLNAKCKSETIMYHCIYVNCEHIRKIYNPSCKYTTYVRYSMFDRAFHKNTIYAKATFLNYTDNILQKACYNPRILYCKSSIHNMFDKANPIITEDIEYF